MRHVSDGELHAYLDGALDHLPEERGEEVREHLSRCSACRERLQDEEISRDGAQEILSLASLNDLHLPAFEELKERAEAGKERFPGGIREEEDRASRYRGPLRGMPLAWAATVVLALGVGWMGGKVWTRSPGSGQGGLSDSAQRGEEDGTIPIIEPEPSPEVSLAEFENPTPAALSRMASPRSDGAGKSTVETSGLAVPGLRVLSVSWEEWAPGERALHIRQILSPGDTLELRYLGMLMGTEPSRERSLVGRDQAAEMSLERPLPPSGLEASLPPGWNQVEMRWGRGWLVARAPLPEASIRALLKTLR